MAGIREIYPSVPARPVRRQPERKPPPRQPDPDERDKQGEGDDDRPPRIDEYA